MLTWTLRLAGWIVGIYALLKLATVAGGVTYTTVFQAWMDSLRNIVDLGFLLTPLKMAIVLPALDLFRSFGWHIPPLQDHWQHVFVLTWLVSATTARNNSEGVAFPSIPVGLMLAFFCTLPFCVAAGVMPLGSLAVPLWPLAGYFVLVAIGNLLAQNWPSSLVIAAFAATVAAAGYFSGASSLGTYGLAALATIVGSAGIFSLESGLRNAKGGICQRLKDPRALSGLDIIAVMLGAFGLATVFADPPLF